MFSNKIYNHFFQELSKDFIIVLFTFTSIVWTVQAVNFLDLVVEDGHAVSVYLKYSLLNIPKIFTKFIPLSFLLALIMTIIKFDSENELTILWTSGLNKIKLINFFFKVSLILTVIQLSLAAIINPYFLNHSRSLIKSSDVDFISETIKTNQFNDTIKGLTIYVEEKSENGTMKNIFLRDDKQIFKSLENSENSKNLTIFAKRGKIIKRNKNFLILEDGIIQSENDSKEVESVKFKRTELLLSGLVTKSIIVPKIQETSSRNLIRCITEKDTEVKIINCSHRNEKNDILSELNRRFGMPLYIPFVSLMASFLLILREESKYKSLYKYLYFGLAFAALILAEILVRYSGKSLDFTLAYYLAPSILIPFVYLILVRKLYYENLKKK